MLAQLGLNAVDEVNAAILSCGDVGATCQSGRLNQLLLLSIIRRFFDECFALVFMQIQSR